MIRYSTRATPAGTRIIRAVLSSMIPPANRIGIEIGTDTRALYACSFLSIKHATPSHITDAANDAANDPQKAVEDRQAYQEIHRGYAP